MPPLVAYLALMLLNQFAQGRRHSRYQASYLDFVRTVLSIQHNLLNRRFSQNIGKARSRQPTARTRTSRGPVVLGILHLFRRERVSNDFSKSARAREVKP